MSNELTDETREHVKTHFKHAVKDAAPSRLPVEVEIEDLTTDGLRVKATVDGSDSISNAHVVNYVSIQDAYRIGATDNGSLVVSWKVDSEDLDKFEVDYL